MVVRNGPLQAAFTSLSENWRLWMLYCTVHRLVTSLYAKMKEGDKNLDANDRQLITAQQAQAH